MEAPRAVRLGVLACVLGLVTLCYLQGRMVSMMADQDLKIGLDGWRFTWRFGVRVEKPLPPDPDLLVPVEHVAATPR